MRVLVLGSTGLLGKDVEKTFKASGARVMAPTRFTLQSWYGVFTFAWMQGELDYETKLDRVRAMIHDLNPDVIVNCIAFVNADSAEEKQQEAHDLNCEFPTLIAEVAWELKRPVIHISTDYVFGGQLGKHRFESNSKYLWKEDDQALPSNVYGVTKRMGEMGVLDNNPQSYVVRTSWLFGSGRTTWIDLALEKEGKYFDLYLSTFGTPTYTVDVAEAILAIAQKRPPAGIYHVANIVTEPVTKFEIMGFARYQAGLQPGMVKGETKVAANRPLNTALDCSKLLKFHNMPGVHNAVNRYLKEIGKYAQEN